MSNMKPVSDLQNKLPEFEDARPQSNKPAFGAQNRDTNMEFLGSKHLRQIISKIDSGNATFVTKSLEELEQMAEG